jgi:hypothetical protein
MLSDAGNQIAWFYIRHTKKDWVKQIKETHRCGCIAMEKLPDNKLKIAFSLAIHTDQFFAAYGRQNAFNKLNLDTKSIVIDVPKDVDDLVEKFPALKAALRRNGLYDDHFTRGYYEENLEVFSLRAENYKNQTAFEGAIKEFAGQHNV